MVNKYSNKFEIGDLVELSYPRALVQVTSKSSMPSIGIQHSYKGKFILSLDYRKTNRDMDSEEYISKEISFLDHQACFYSIENAQEFADYLNKNLLLINFK